MFVLVSRRAVRWPRGSSTGCDCARPLPPLLCDQPDALPLSAGQDRAESVHRTQGPQCRRAQRCARPDRLPPQPDGGLSPQLHRMFGLHFGARGGGRFRALGHPAQEPQAQQRSGHFGVQAVVDTGTIRAAPALSCRAPPRRRNGEHGRDGFRRHGGAHPGQHLCHRIPRAGRRWQTGQAGWCLPDRPAGRRALDDLQLLRTGRGGPAGSWKFHHSRSHPACRTDRIALCLPRILGRRFGADAVQGALPAARTPGP